MWQPGPSGCDDQCGSTAVDAGCGCDRDISCTKLNPVEKFTYHLGTTALGSAVETLINKNTKAVLPFKKEKQIIELNDTVKNYLYSGAIAGGISAVVGTIIKDVTDKKNINVGRLMLEATGISVLKNIQLKNVLKIKL